MFIIWFLLWFSHNFAHECSEAGLYQVCWSFAHEPSEGKIRKSSLTREPNTSQTIIDYRRLTVSLLHTRGDYSLMSAGRRTSLTGFVPPDLRTVFTTRPSNMTVATDTYPLCNTQHTLLHTTLIVIFVYSVIFHCILPIYFILSLYFILLHLYILSILPVYLISFILVFLLLSWPVFLVQHMSL